MDSLFQCFVNTISESMCKTARSGFHQPLSLFVNILSCKHKLSEHLSFNVKFPSIFTGPALNVVKFPSKLTESTSTWSAKT